MKTNRLKLCAAMMCCALMVGAVEADSLVYNLKDVEVVATRANDATPVTYTMVTAKQLSKMSGGVDIPYLLQTTPSVVITSDAGTGIGYSSISVRGTDGSRINVTNNGIPLNDAESQRVYWVNIPDFASSVKDIQVQRGVGTSTNGPAAFGASINMATTTPSVDAYATLDAAYGMYNTNRQTLKVGSGLLGDHWTVDAKVSHIGSDGYIDRASARLWSYFGQVGYYNGTASVKLITFGGKERTYHAWDYATRSQIEQYGRRYNPCGEYTDADGKIAYYPNQYDYYSQYHYQLVYNQTFANRWHINVGLHYTKGDGYYEQYKSNQSLNKYGLTPYYALSDPSDPASQLEYVKKSDLVRLKKMDNGFGGGVFSVKYNEGRLTAILGGGLNKYNGDHFGQISWIRHYNGPLNPLQEYYRNNASKVDGNIYARGNVELGRGLTGYVDLQMRHTNYRIEGIGDNYDSSAAAMERLGIRRHYNFFNPKAGLVYTMSRQNRLYASVAVSHREPTRDNFIDCAPDRLPVPERLTDYELGYSRVGDILSGGINLYYMDYKDQLVATGRLSDTGNSVQENVPRSYRMGVELYYSLKPLSWFDWDLTTTLSRNRIKQFDEYIYGDSDPMIVEHKDTPIAFSPGWTLSNSFNFKYKVFDASLQTTYVGRQYLDNTGRRSISLDPYCVSDLHLGCTMHGIAGLKELRLGMIIYNLFSEKYESNGWAYTYYYTGDDGKKIVESDAGYSVQAPVHVMGTVTIKF